MNTEPNNTAPRLFRRRLRQEFLSRWKWWLIIFLICDVLLAWLLLHLSDGRPDLPVLWLSALFAGPGIALHSSFTSGGWWRVLHTLPLTREERLDILCFFILFPAAMWICASGAVLLAAVIFGDGTDSYSALVTALVYGTAASFAAFFALEGMRWRQGCSWLFLMSILLGPGVFLKTSHGAAFLFALPLVIIAAIAWREIEKQEAVPPRTLMSNAPLSMVQTEAPRCELLKKQSRPLCRRLLQDSGLWLAAGCLAGGFIYWLAKPETLNRSPESMMKFFIKPVWMGNLYVLAFMGPAVRLWRGLPLSGMHLPAFLCCIHLWLMTCVASGIILVMALLSRGEMCPAAPDTRIVISCLLPLCLTVPVMLRFSGENLFWKAFGFYIPVSVLAQVFDLHKLFDHPQTVFTAGMTVALASVWWTHRLLSRSATYPRQGERRDPGVS